MGRDACAGVAAIRAAGGAIVVQNPAEADYPQMPAGAWAAASIERVVDIARALRFLCGSAAAATVRRPPR
jgi:two-component system CheB/CheR fusion protein